MHTKRTLTLVALTLMLALPALAQPPGVPGPGGGPGPGAGPGLGDAPGAGHARVLAEFLDLTAEQTEQATALRQQLRDTLQPLAEQLHDLEAGLRAEIGAADPAATTIGETVLAIHDLRARMDQARQAFGADFVALLTAEQAVRYEAFRAASQLLRQGRGDRGPAGDRPPRRGRGQGTPRG